MPLSPQEIERPMWRSWPSDEARLNLSCLRRSRPAGYRSRSSSGRPGRCRSPRLQKRGSDEPAVRHASRRVRSRSRWRSRVAGAGVAALAGGGDEECQTLRAPTGEAAHPHRADVGRGPKYRAAAKVAVLGAFRRMWACQSLSALIRGEPWCADRSRLHGPARPPGRPSQVSRR